MEQKKRILLRKALVHRAVFSDFNRADSPFRQLAIRQYTSKEWALFFKILATKFKYCELDYFPIGSRIALCICQGYRGRNGIPIDYIADENKDILKRGIRGDIPPRYLFYAWFAVMQNFTAYNSTLSEFVDKCERLRIRWTKTENNIPRMYDQKLYYIASGIHERFI